MAQIEGSDTYMVLSELIGSTNAYIKTSNIRAFVIGGTYKLYCATRGYIGDITSKPLSYVAMKIREANDLITNEYIRSHIDFNRGFEHLGDARKLFVSNE
ncbi:hypothetical protein RYX36_032248, partial [Vicia faba]